VKIKKELEVISVLEDIVKHVTLWGKLTRMLIHGDEKEKESAHKQMKKWLEENTDEE
jgi:hypothetical protein